MAEPGTRNRTWVAHVHHLNCPGGHITTFFRTSDAHVLDTFPAVFSRQAHVHHPCGTFTAFTERETNYATSLRLWA